jgi:NAD-dependent protein deacetylases, SIR2 family
MDIYTEVAKAILEAQKITVLTGAGISTASGIPDFRSRNGLYDNNIDIDTILSEQQFQMNPEKFWGYYKKIFRVKLTQHYKPNFGHLYLQELEKQQKEVTILTQNVDGLHRKAGSKNVYELHGTIEKAFCPFCKREYSLYYIVKEDIPKCSNDYTILKPDVVLFGGKVRHMEKAYESASETNLFLTMGTSLTVYPVRDIPGYMQNAKGIKKVIINKEPTRFDSIFNYIVHEDINTALQQINNRTEQIKNASP